MHNLRIINAVKTSLICNSCLTGKHYIKKTTTKTTVLLHKQMHKICITKVYRFIMFHDGQIAALSVGIKFINSKSIEIIL